MRAEEPRRRSKLGAVWSLGILDKKIVFGAPFCV